METALLEVLRHFQADKSAAYHHSFFRSAVFDKSAYLKGVLHGAQGEDPVAVNAGNVRNDRFRSG